MTPYRVMILREGLPKIMLTRLWDSRRMLLQTLWDVISKYLQWWANFSKSMDHYWEARWGWKLVIQLPEVAFLISKQYILPFMWSRKSLLCLIFIKLWNEVLAVGVSLMPAVFRRLCLSSVFQIMPLQCPHRQEHIAQMRQQLFP